VYSPGLYLGPGVFAGPGLCLKLCCICTTCDDQLVTKYQVFRILDSLHATATGLDQLPAWYTVENSIHLTDTESCFSKSTCWFQTYIHSTRFNSNLIIIIIHLYSAVVHEYSSESLSVKSYTPLSSLHHSYSHLTTSLPSTQLGQPLLP